MDLPKPSTTIETRIPTELDTPPVDGKLASWVNPALIGHIKQAKVLVNIERAYRIMDKYGLDGIVASLPLNIYYLSSYLGPMIMMGRSFSCYAFLPRREDAPPCFVPHGSMVYHMDWRPTWMPVEAYSYPIRTPEGEMAEPMPSPNVHNFRPDSLNDRDRVLMAIYAQYEGRTSASALAALIKGITKAGCAQGKLGFDDPRVLNWLNQEGLRSLTGIDAINIFREIRMVKTPNEIEILREASVRNEAALDYAIETMHVGQPLDDVEFQHGLKWGQLGGKSLWCITNQNGLASGVIRADTVTKLDSVGQYQGYLGDVGRTVVVGTPSDEVMRRNEANTKGLAACYAAIKPGVTFAEAGAIVCDVMAQHGFKGFAGAHPVGLEHTDQPWPTGVHNDLPGLYDPLVFEEGTVFTMDVPYHEIGYGTSHVEDMMLVTADGCVGLSSTDTRLRVRPA